MLIFFQHYSVLWRGKVALGEHMPQAAVIARPIREVGNS